MPAIRKPIEVLELSGAFAKNPQRRPTQPSKPKHPIGDPPKYFSSRQRAIWRELCEMMPDVLSEGDRWTVEIAVRLMARFRDPADMLSTGELSKLVNILSLMGATPADRARLTLPRDEKAANPFSEFMQ